MAMNDGNGNAQPTRDEALRIVQGIITAADDDGDKITVDFFEGMQRTLTSWRGQRITPPMVRVILVAYERIWGFAWFRKDDEASDPSPSSHPICPRCAKTSGALAPSQFRTAMNTIVLADDLAEHIAADNLLCRVLRQLGYGEGIDLYEERFAFEKAAPKEVHP